MQTRQPALAFPRSRAKGCQYILRYQPFGLHAILQPLPGVVKQFVEGIAVRAHLARDLFQGHTLDVDGNQSLALLVGPLGSYQSLQTLQEEVLNHLLVG